MAALTRSKLQVRRPPTTAVAAGAIGVMVVVMSGCAPTGSGEETRADGIRAAAAKGDTEDRGTDLLRRLMPTAMPKADPPPAETALNGNLELDRGKYRVLPDVPGAESTTYFRNNNLGQYAGTSVEIEGDTVRSSGFLAGRDGKQTRIDVPGAQLTAALGINDRGQVVGAWTAPDATPNPITGEREPIHGFIWERGRVKKFDLPGAFSIGPYEISNRGEIVGNYVDKDRIQHGFVYRNGKLKLIDHPRAAQGPNLTATRIHGVDDQGRLAGTYADASGSLHAWTWANGRFKDLTPPGAVQSAATQINNEGQVAGIYIDATPKLRTFVYERGRYRLIDVPDRCDTGTFAINDRGQIGIPAVGTLEGSTCPREEAALPGRESS